MAADEWTWKIHNASEVVSTPRVFEARYGGGYRQITADGGANNLLVLNVTIPTTTKANIDDMHTFLQSKAGATPFLWTPPAPFDTQKRWVCQEWRSTWVGGDIMSFGGKFEEVS